MLPRLKNYPTEGAMTLANGESYVIVLGAQSSNFLRVASASAAFRIRLDDTYEIAVSAGKKFDSLPNKFSKVEVINNSGAPLTFLLEIGSGSISSDEVVLAGVSGVSDADTHTKLDTLDISVQAAATAATDTKSAVNSVLAMMQNDELQRMPLTTLAGATFAEKAAASDTTVVSGAANVNGVIIRYASVTCASTNSTAYVKVNGNNLLHCVGSAGGGCFKEISNVFIPAGQAVLIGQTVNIIPAVQIYYEVL